MKPKGVVQWQFRYRWLYGLLEPASGESFLLELSHLDRYCFEEFLKEFSAQYPNEHHVMQVDNAGSHRASSLTIPDNIVLLYQPAYCPEVNPIERLWEEMRRELSWRRFASLEALQDAISHWSAGLYPSEVGRLTGWAWLLEALSVAGI